MRRKLPLSLRILLGLGLGVLSGLALQDAPEFAAAWIQPFGTLFLNLVKMLVVPLVFCSLTAGVCALFIANAYGIPLALPQQLTIILTCTLASVGTAGVPGAGAVMLGMVLQSVGLPVEGVALVLGIDRVLDMARTAVNVAGDLACAVVVSAAEPPVEKGPPA